MSDAPSGASADDADSGSAAPAGAPAHVGDTGASHTITITANQHRVRVIHQGVTFADTRAGFTLSESGHADVFYFPRADVNMARLKRSDHTTDCPFKGAASYFHLRTEDETIENAVWSYEKPLEQVKQIAGYLAFHASRVDRIDQTS